MRKQLVCKIEGNVARFVIMTFSSPSTCCDFNDHGPVNLKLMHIFVFALLKDETMNLNTFFLKEHNFEQ